MASKRAIKRKIRSVKSTQQITKAMNLVATSKLQRSKSNLETSKPFFLETKRAIYSILSASKRINHKYTKIRPVNNIAVILLTADRGLCGGYNVNVSKEALKLVTEKGNEHMIIVGTKGRDYFRRRRKNVVRNYSGISEKPFYQDAAEIGELAIDMYNNNEVDEIYIVYTQFNSMISHEPKAVRILPIDEKDFLPPASTEATAAATAAPYTGVMNYEPDEATVLDYIIPKYINTYIYGAMVESAACEQGARMTSMDSASKNAIKMIDSFTSQYNKARQGAITQELNEIVSGANALN